MPKQRDRGRVLTAEALERFNHAVREWEFEKEQRLTQERLRELTAVYKEGGLDPGTLSKIRKAQQPVDPGSIEIVFKSLGLTLQETDLIPLAGAIGDGIQRETRVDWGEKPDTSIFFGRVEELATLNRWILVDRCRVVSLLAMGGMGKTALAAKLSDRLQGQFDFIIWRSVREAPPLQEILVRIIQFLSEQQETEINLPRRLGERINRLLHYLREKRCFIILDNLESILDPDRAGCYREGYEDYGEVIHQVGRTDHQSCLVLTSRERPGELAQLEGSASAVRSWPVGGLAAEAALEILKAKGLELDLAQSQERVLLDRCGGNPQVLRLVATEIQELFFGDVADFLTERELSLGSAQGLLREQWERLTELEKSVMYWLMINREPVSLNELMEDLLPPVEKQKVRVALRSLVNRSLIEQVGMSFTLQNVVMECLTNQFVESINQETATQELTYFHTHALIKVNTKNYVRETQIRLILDPIRNCYRMTELNISKILEIAVKSSQWSQGYLAGNLLNIVCKSNTQVGQYDFSNATLRHSYLKFNNIHKFNFSHSHFIHSLLIEDLAFICTVAFSPDRNLLAIGDINGRLHIWQTEDRKYIQVLEGHTNWVRSAAFSPNGQVLASGGSDSTVRLWDMGSYECLHVLEGHTNWVRSVAFSPDGQVLASGGSDSTVRLWDMGSYECLHVLEGHTNWVRSVAFSPDGQVLASGGNDSTVRLWDMDSYECLHVLEGHTNEVRSVAFSPNGQVLASGSSDSTVRLWDMGSYECLHVLEGHTNEVESVAFSPDGQVLASGGGDSTVRLWDMGSYECLHVLEGHTNGVWSVTLSPDGQVLASGSSDSTVRLWDMGSYECLHVLEGHTNEVESVAFSPDGQVLASGGGDSTVRLWDMGSYECLHILEGHTNGVWSVTLSPDGQVLASGSSDSTVRLWDMGSYECLHVLEGHTNEVESVAFSPDGQVLASGGGDSTVRLWDVGSYECLHILEGHTNGVWSVTLSPDGQVLASGSSDSTVQLWDMGSYECLQVLEGHTNWVRSVAFSPDDQTLASGSVDSQVRLWNVATGECVAVLQIPRPYESTNITGVTGLTEAQKAAMIALGAFEE